MPPSRRQQIEALYHAARERGADALAGAPDDLRREAELLLSQEATATRVPAFLEDRSQVTETIVEPGRMLGPYRIGAPIGQGGMGQVFLAIDTRLNRRVAIKTSLRPFDPRFQREARVIATLNHPNICTLYDVGPNYLVMELCEGETLAARIKRGKLPIDEILRIGSQIAAALAAAHAKDVIHRDLKPANVMLSPHGVKVLDFGLAKVEGDDTLTAPMAVMGTPAYMAPEQYEGKATGTRTDLFALGLMLYEMAEGERPFPGANPGGLIAAGQSPPPMTSDLPSEFRSLIASMTERAVDRRPPSAEAVRETLDQIRSQPAEPGARRQSLRFRTAWKWVLAAAAAILIGGSAAYVIHRSGATRQVRSIAVLPLKNLSGDPSQEFVAEGATEELIADLGQIHAFDKVISRTSTAQYAASPKPMPEIGRELGVDAIVEGSIQRMPDRIRFRVQLIRAPTDAQLWSNSYDRAGSDVLSIQAEVARAIAQEIRAQLTPDERRQLSRSASILPAAQDAYLQGLFHVKFATSGEHLERAVEYFKEATQLQPGYSAAYEGLAEAWFHRYYFGGGHDAEAPARTALKKALELNPNSPTAHAINGALLSQWDWDWATGERELRRALEIDPQNTEALRDLGRLLTATLRFPEAMTLLRRAVELDPLTGAAYSDYGRGLYRARRYAEAEEQLRRAAELDPGGGADGSRLADVYEQSDRVADGLKIRERLVNASPSSFNLAALARAYALSGDKMRARQYLDRAIAAKLPNAAAIATTFAVLDEKDRAFEWLARGLDDRDNVWSWRCDPVFDSLRSDPRFEALLMKIGIPQ